MLMASTVCVVLSHECLLLFGLNCELVIVVLYREIGCLLVITLRII